MSRVHVAPSATANGELEVYGLPPLSVAPSEQVRLQPTSFVCDPPEQVIAEERVGEGEGGEGEGGKGLGGGGDGGGLGEGDGGVGGGLGSGDSGTRHAPRSGRRRRTPSLPPRRGTTSSE